MILSDLILVIFKISFNNRNQQFNNSQNNLSFTYPRNEYIRANEVFVIDQEGNQIGVISRDEALRMAREAELDLILVAPNANPPVAKIYSWSKFKYQQEKKKKDNKGKSAEQKEIWFNIFIGQGDLEHKITLVKEFLDKKHPVKLTIRAKGRITYLQEKQLLDKIIGMLEGEIEEVAETPKQEGRNMTLIVRPIKNKKVINIEKKQDNE